MNKDFDPGVKGRQFANFMNRMKSDFIVETDSESDSEFEFNLRAKSKSKNKLKPVIKTVATPKSNNKEPELPSSDILDSSTDSDIPDCQPAPVIELPPVNDDIICAAEITMENSEVSVFINDRIAMNKTQLKLRRHQPFRMIFNHFAELHKIDREDLYLDYEGAFLSPTDTVYSIGYSAKFLIEVSKRSANNSFNAFDKKKQSKKTNTITLKFQSSKTRCPIDVSIKNNDLMKIGMAIACEHFELDPRHVHFFFDGDKINYKDTPTTLDLTDGDIIDVKVVQDNDTSLPDKSF